MGLFDDLLKKPTVDNATHDDATSGTGGNPQTDGSTGGNPPSDPFVQVENSLEIQKTEEISIITESPAETAAAMPAPVTVNAVEDTSSIIIGSTTPNIPDTTSVFTHVEVATPVTTTISEPIIQDIGILGLADDTSTPVEPQVVTDNSTSLMDIITEDTAGSKEDSIVVSTPESTEASDDVAVIVPVETIVTPVESVTTSSETISSEEVQGIADIFTSTEETKDEEVMSVAPETYEHPMDFIEASIGRIDAMIERIDEIYDAKMAEAASYKTEKEKYTNLEQQAYLDAQKYVQEKKHALAMRLYFVEQGKSETSADLSTPVASVETTLTGLAVQNAVSETVKPEKKKVKKEKTEMIA